MIYLYINKKSLVECFRVTADAHCGFIGPRQCIVARKNLRQKEKLNKKRERFHQTAGFVAYARNILIFKTRNQQSRGVCNILHDGPYQEFGR